MIKARTTREKQLEREVRAGIKTRALALIDRNKTDRADEYGSGWNAAFAYMRKAFSTQARTTRK